MNWQEPKRLALALRDQGLCDCIAARANLRADSFQVLGRATNLAHLVVAKCQQSVEKIMKGYLLWHSGSFDPTKGHAPFTNALIVEPAPAREITALCTSLNRLNRQIVAELKWLESMAPHPPSLTDEEKGKPVPLHKIKANSEYALLVNCGKQTPRCRGRTSDARSWTTGCHGTAHLLAGSFKIGTRAIHQRDRPVFRGTPILHCNHDRTVRTAYSTHGDDSPFPALVAVAMVIS